MAAPSIARNANDVGRPEEECPEGSGDGRPAADREADRGAHEQLLGDEDLEEALRVDVLEPCQAGRIANVRIEHHEVGPSRSQGHEGLADRIPGGDGLPHRPGGKAPRLATR
jgi:hypothetical protein